MVQSKMINLKLSIFLALFSLCSSSTLEQNETISYFEMYCQLSPVKRAEINDCTYLVLHRDHHSELCVENSLHQKSDLYCHSRWICGENAFAWFFDTFCESHQLCRENYPKNKSNSICSSPVISLAMSDECYRKILIILLDYYTLWKNCVDNKIG